jgi:predicted RNA-binding protein YlqC (UPF0109 family)
MTVKKAAAGTGGREVAESVFPDLARSVVVHQGEVHVDVRHGSRSSTVAVTPSDEEAGNLIGKHGRCVKSMQLLAKLAGRKHGWPVAYAVVVGQGQNPPPADRQEPPLPWDGQAAEELLRRLLASFLAEPFEVSRSTVGEGDTTHVSFEVVLSASEPVARAQMFAVPDCGGPPQVLAGDEAVSVAVNTLMKAAGKVRGTKVHVEVVRVAEPPPLEQERQPESADGSYARTL